MNRPTPPRPYPGPRLRTPRGALRICLALALALAAPVGFGCSKPEPPPVAKPAASFPSLVEGWRQIEGSGQALKAASATGDLRVTANEARRLVELVRGLSPLSSDYASARGEPLELAAKELDRMAGDIQAAAERGDRNGAVDSVQKIRRALRYVHGLYPAGVLPPMLP